MQFTTSQMFDFLEQQEAGTIERHEVASASFGALRRSLRQIVLKLRDSDDQEALNASDQLRALISEWLTVPVSFDHLMLDAMVNMLGSSEAVQTRWGSDIRILYDAAHRAAMDLLSIDSPVREKLRAVIGELRRQERTFKIYCHRRARPHFETLFSSPADEPLPVNTFLHSVRDYRETGLFDDLIKFGPLRARGWGAAPDALLIAPRFNILIQIVWSGCNDEQDFGYDPVSSTLDAPPAEGAPPTSDMCARHGPVKWITRVMLSGDDPGAVAGDSRDIDELQVFREMNLPRENRPATLVQVNGEHGILYPPHTRILSFDPNQAAREPVGLRIPGETLLEGMYVIMPSIGDVDLGGVQAEHGHFSQIWKARLRESFSADAADLIKRLRAAGLNLVSLVSAIRHWCNAPSTVIHAPQKLSHFKILLQVLGVDNDDNSRPRSNFPPFSQLAWNEIRRSRGEAIQAGFQEHEIIDEQVLTILSALVPQIRETLANEGYFLVIPEGYGINGLVILFKVHGIEEGFSAPVTDLKVVRELRVIDQWRG